MSRLFRMSPFAQWAAVLLVTLALVPRLVMLGERPLMHDESLFAYYAYNFMQTGHYTHLPILHGPVLMLSTGMLFKIFGDTIGVGRAMIAVASLIGLAAAVALWPRRYRWWLAPMLITSPVFLYYSRFLRDDMLFSSILMLGMFCLTRGLTRRPLRALWTVAGLVLLLFLLAVMENCLFVYASALTFGATVLLVRLFWKRPAPALRERPRAPLRSYNGQAGTPAPVADKPARRRKGETYLNKSFATVVGDAPRPAEEAELADAPDTPDSLFPEVPGSSLFDTIRAKLHSYPFVRRLGKLPWAWLVGILLGLAIPIIIYGLTSDEGKFTPLKNLKDTWDYWKGQHELHRIEGAIHYYLPILLTYELPVLFFLTVGFVWDACLRWARAAVYAGALLGWVLVWYLWSLLAYPVASAPHWLKAVMYFLHVEPNTSMLVLGLIFTPLLAWSILSLKEHRTLAAWMGWWAACSLFQYSSAGEKVPWLAVHIMLPLYMTLGWLWAPKLRRLRWPLQMTALLLMLVTTAIALRNDYYLIGPRAADPRERILYNHTTPDFDKLCKSQLARWESYSEQTPLAQRRVALVADPGWPGFWYFRHCAYLRMDDPPAQITPDAYDLVLGTKSVMEPTLERIDPNLWNIRELSLRNAWLAPWPEKDCWRAWWRYYWFRETWTPVGGFPIISLEPMKTRR